MMTLKYLNLLSAFLLEKVRRCLTDGRR